VALSEKGRLFAEYIVSGDVQIVAAEKAGYKHPKSVSSRLYKNAEIQAYIRQLTSEMKASKIANAIERQEFWTSVMRGEEATGTDNEGNEYTDMKDKLKASELLGKAQSDFVDKSVVEVNINPVESLMNAIAGTALRPKHSND